MPAADEAARDVRGDQADEADRADRRHGDAGQSNGKKQQQEALLHDVEAQRGGDVIAKQKYIQLRKVRPHDGQEHCDPRQQGVDIVPAAAPQAAGEPEQRHVNIAGVLDNQVLCASLEHSTDRYAHQS